MIDKEYNRIRDNARRAAEHYETLVAELIPEDRRIEFIRSLDDLILTRDRLMKSTPAPSQ